ncbi:hypothetical protein OHB24_21410 [Kribbella sp. NBC_00482]|uniref:AbiTii domain-containing protein n=1 Tax=Kribbella sp. NBC_00482 TaxID=2975968 RepID=UPI002E19EA06
MQRRLGKIERDLLANRPLRDCLRQCVSLGGDLRSARLRDWAMKELMGYREGDGIPSYRTVTPILLGDGQTFRAQFSQMAIPWMSLPRMIRDDVKDSLDLVHGVAMLEENASASDARGDGIVKMALPMTADIGRLMSNDSVYFERIYWAVGTSVFRGVLDEIRTTAVSVLAELRSGMPTTGIPPTAAGEVADQAVNVVVYGGRRNTFNIQTNQARDGGVVKMVADNDQGESLRWTKRQTYWTVAGVILAIITLGVTFYLT